MSDWISVQQEPPPKGKIVIGYTVQGGTYTGKQLPWGWNANGGTRQVLTHWMPLPAPPEDETK